MSVDNLFMQGLAFHQQGQLELARSLYEQVLQLKPRYVDALHLLGVIEYQRQRPEQAVDLIQRAIAIKPSEPGMLANLGLPLADLGQHEEALRCFDRAIALQPEYADAHYNRGNALMRLKRTHEAAESFQRAIDIRPAHAKSHYNLGIVLHELKQFELSVSSYERAIAIWPDYAHAYSNLGNALQALERHEAAVASYDRAIGLQADFAEAYSNKGNALLKLDRVEEAIACIERAIALEPNYAEAHSNLGNALLRQRQPEQALACYEQALSLKPDHAEAHNNKGEALRDLGKPDLALSSYERAIELQPDFAEAYANLGNALKDLGRPEEALRSCQRAIELDPGQASARWNLGLHMLSEQLWKEGWEAYHYRKKTKKTSVIPYLNGVPVWQAGPPSGRLLVVAEQGIGDEVFLSKGLSLFSQRFGAPACVVVDPRLVSLFSRSFPDMRFVARSEMDQLDPQAFDLQMAMGDLAALLVADPILQPVLGQPHLKSDISNPIFLINPTQRPRVGLAWKSKNAKFGAEKSMVLMQLISACKDMDVEWINLQYGEVHEEIAQVWSATGIKVNQVAGVDVDNDLDAWLKLIAECDAVLTTSNSTAHFAGAIGKPGVVMAPFGKGKLWYWHPEDGPSVWYPSLQVFHAKKHQGWDHVLSDARHWLLANLPRCK